MGQEAPRVEQGGLQESSEVTLAEPAGTGCSKSEIRVALEGVPRGRPQARGSLQSLEAEATPSERAASCAKTPCLFASPNLQVLGIQKNRIA